MQMIEEQEAAVRKILVLGQAVGVGLSRVATTMIPGTKELNVISDRIIDAHLFS